jgi:hypothetical protein
MLAPFPRLGHIFSLRFRVLDAKESGKPLSFAAIPPPQAEDHAYLSLSETLNSGSQAISMNGLCGAGPATAGLHDGSNTIWRE